MTQDEPTVTAGDVARLAGVGRAAVSNWRRRFRDFPSPVGGTSSSPLFSLREMERWLRSRGKLAEPPSDEPVWQLIRNSTEDLRLASLVGSVASRLVGPDLERLLALPDADLASAIGGDPPVPVFRAVAGLRAERGTVATVEFLFRRYAETHSRRVQVVPPEVAGVMAELLGRCATILDPICGFGAGLLAAQPYGLRLLGQERDADAARLAAARLKARGADAEICTGDALTADAFPGLQADGVLCVPPSGERDWGFEELANDPRWAYGLPPRGEPELAWVQHCLARVRPGGRVVVLMPPAAANRRSGRRIRSELLRAGAVKSVIELRAGSHLWVLRRPDDAGRRPAEVTMAEEGGEGLPVPVIDLLDEEVDLTPSHYTPRGQAVRPEELADIGKELSGRAAALAEAVPEVAADPRDLAVTTVGELAKAGALTLEQSPLRSEDAAPAAAVPAAEDAVLTAEDVVLGRAATGRGRAGPESVVARPGDVVVTAAPGATTARVLSDEVVLGPHLLVIRVDGNVLDAHFVAGYLCTPGTRGTAASSAGGRAEVRRARLPRLPIDEQRRYGRLFRRLADFEEAVRRTGEAGRRLAERTREGLLEGDLRPVSE